MCAAQTIGSVDLDRLILLAKKQDPQWGFTDSELADKVLNRSGLDQKERRKVFDACGGLLDAS